MLAKQYKYLIFDFDGTINDTSRGIYATFTAVLAHFGIDARCKDLSEHIGPPLKYSYTKLVGSERCQEAIDLHRKIFAETNAIEQSALYDGIVDVLDRLKSSGKYQMAIASCKYQPHLLKSLELFNLQNYFVSVYAQVPDRLYKADVIRQLITDNGWAKEDCLMIGDTLHDVDGAKANGIDVVAVTYGFEQRKKLEQSQTVALLDKPSQIADLLL